MYNFTQIVLKNGNELGVVALVDIQKDTEPFKLSNMENLKHVFMKEIELNNLHLCVREHVKNFVFERKKNDNFYAYVTKDSVSALVMNDNEKMYHVPNFYLKGEYWPESMNTL
jgi:hypothetical protein